VLIANNLLDFHTKLFYGGLNYAVIEGNMIDLENDDDAIAKIHIVSGGKNISIVGNTLTGYMSTGANVPARKGKLGIRFDVLAQGCTIVGNSLSGFADAAIDVSAGATGSTIAANTLFDNNIALRLNGTFTSSIVSNNAYSGNSTMNGGLPTFSSDSRFDVRGTFVKEGA
jgi:nitrous oxidase accessory protein NosD